VSRSSDAAGEPYSTEDAAESEGRSPESEGGSAVLEGGPADTGSGWPAPVAGATPYSGTSTPGTVTVSRGTSLGNLVAGFAGFSFEKSHLTDGWFSGTNAPLIALFRLLGPGFVRIGANDVNRTQWQAGAMPVAGGQTSPDCGTADVDGLAAFIKATSWQVLYGLNISQETTPNTTAAISWCRGVSLGRALSVDHTTDNEAASA
jgi:hypothetical protein